MSKMDEKTERLIVRKLDGELTADEQLELDRTLLRDPEARALYESYERIDACAAGALAQRFDAAAEPRPVLAVPQYARQPAPRRSRWMFAGSAVAACLALAVFWSTPPATETSGDLSSTPLTSSAPTVPPVIEGTIPASTVGGSDVGVWRMNEGPPRRLDRTTQRNLLVVPDAEGNLYLINVDRVREVQLPRRGPEVVFTRDPI